jgi:hypothetical protein
MKKFIILLLIIFAVSYAQNIYEYEVKEHYYQILLKEWQKSGSYQEFDPRSITSEMRKSCETRDIAQEELNKYYKELKTLSIRIASIGKYFEYELVCVRGLPKKEQLWMLISVPLKKVVATYKDKIKPDMPMKDSSWVQEWEARWLYIDFLERLKTDTPFPCSLKWGGLYTWGNSFEAKENIDSATAVYIATKAAQECYGPEMAALVPRLMGNNEEHWLVYCFPSIQFKKRSISCYGEHLVWYYENERLIRTPETITACRNCYDGYTIFLGRGDDFEDRMARCYHSLMWHYTNTRLYLASLMKESDMSTLPAGFQLIFVLISKLNGQVLYMEELRRPPVGTR